MRHKLNFFGIFIFLAFFVLGSASVRAADELDLSPSGDKLFDVHNMVPGASKTEEFCAQNDHADEAGDYYLNVEDVTDDHFSDELKFYLTDRSSGNYFIGGPGDRFTVQEMNSEGNVFIERLGAGEKNCYKMKIAFNANAGNEFQARKTVFDFDFKLVSELASPGPPPLRPGVPAGGIPAAAGGEVAGESVTVPEAAGATTEVSGVLGAAEELCAGGWPLWAWILILIVHTIVSGVKRLFRYQWAQRFGLPLQMLSLIIVLLLWYFFDVCWLYPWVPYVAVIMSIISLLLFQVWNNHNRSSGRDFPDVSER